MGGERMAVDVRGAECPETVVEIAGSLSQLGCEGSGGESPKIPTVCSQSSSPPRAVSYTEAAQETARPLSSSPPGIFPHGSRAGVAFRRNKLGVFGPAIELEQLLLEPVTLPVVAGVHGVDLELLQKKGDQPVGRVEALAKLKTLGIIRGYQKSEKSGPGEE